MNASIRRALGLGLNMKLSRSVLPVLAMGAALAGFAAYGSDARAATLPVDGPSVVALNPGSQLAVVVVTFHNSDHANVTTVTVGNAVHVRVTVAGAFGTPIGFVNGAMYPNATCSGQAIDFGNPTQLVNGAVDLTSLSAAPKAAGKLSVSVHYPGEVPYAAATSACTSITVTKATPSVGLQVHDEWHHVIDSLPFGGTVHPYVSVLSRVGAPTGFFTVSWWKNAACSGPQAGQSINIGLGLGGHDEVLPFAKSASPVGKFSFKAHYAGDAGFKALDSACVPYSVTKLTPEFVAAIHDMHHQTPEILVVGAQVHPYASLKWPAGMPAPTGSVNVIAFSDGACTLPKLADFWPAEAQVEVYGMATTRSSPGVLSWQIAYGGSAIYNAVTAGCIKRTWKSLSTASLAIHDGDHNVVATAPEGTWVHFRIKMEGEFGTPDGQAHIRAYTNGTCGGSGAIIALAAFSNGLSHDLQHQFVLDDPGTFSYRAEYHGDESYIGDLSPCEAITVTAEAAPTAAPTAKPTTKPTSTPNAGATAGPVPTGAVAGETAVATASGEPAASGDPASSAEAGSGSSAGPSSGAGAGVGGGGPTSPSGDSGLGSGWLVLLVILALVLFGAGMLFGRRPRRQSSQA